MAPSFARSILPAVLVAPLLFLANGCSKPSLSGDYVLSSTKGTGVLSLVQSPGGSLSGRLELAAVIPTGELQDRSARVSGISDGRYLTLGVREDGPNGAESTMAGEARPGAIVLHSGGGAGDLMFVRGQTGRFDTEMNRLRIQGRKIRASLALAARKAQADQAETIAAGEVQPGLDAAAELDARLAQLPRRVALLKSAAATAALRMGALREAGRSAMGLQAAAIRSQTAEEVEQISTELDRQRKQIAVAGADLLRRDAAVKRMLQERDTRCRTAVPTPLCVQLGVALTSHETAGAAARRALADLEAFWSDFETRQAQRIPAEARLASGG